MPPRVALHPCVLISMLLSSAVAVPVRGELQPVDRMQFLIMPGQPAKLQWRLDSANAPNRLTYEISDYGGRTLLTSDAELSSQREVTVPVELAHGYYEVAFPELKERFGICVLPPSAQPPDPFFCIDSALSWLEKREALRSVLPRMLKRLGISSSRERLRWGAIQPTKDRWDWEAGEGYESARKSYAQAGVGVLEMGHDAPAWAGARRHNRYPADLPATAASWGHMAKRWRPLWSALEIWNEPDIFFGSDLPADQYVQLAKAVAYGVRDAQPALPLVGGAFTGVCPDDYRRLCAQNGLLDHVDAISFHTYDPPDRLESLVQTYRAWLGQNGKASMPLWITEAGRPWKKGPRRPPLAEDAASAADITMKAVEARACGVAAFFAFVYVYYEENANNFGMLGQEVTPLRALAGYAQATGALAHLPYRGDLVDVEPPVKRARVFGNATTSVIVLYSGQTDAQRNVRLPIPFKQVSGIDGRLLPPTPAGAVPIPDGLTYVWADSAALGNHLRTDTAAMRLYHVSRQAAPSRPAPSPIILQHVFDPRNAEASKHGYRLTAEQAARFALRVKVNNLSDHEHRVELMLIAETQPHKVITRSVEVPSGSDAEVAWELEVAGMADSKDACTLVVTGQATGVDRISPLAINLSVPQQKRATRPN